MTTQADPPPLHVEADSTGLPANSPTGAPASAVDFDAWVAARGQRLMRFAVLVCGDPAEAADCAQEALVSTYRHWKRISGSGTEDAYLRRCVTNHHISRWRAFRRRESAADVEGLPSTTISAEDVVMSRYDEQQAWRLCQQLNRTQRAAVVLRYYEELSFAEIADILGCAESTARSHVHRALARLRARLEDERT